MKFNILVKTVVFTIINLVCFSQNNKSEIFDSLKTYQYKALFIDKNGDTLTNEKIIFQPTGKIWEYQNTQTVARFIFFPDSVAHLFLDPRSKKPKYMIIANEVNEGVIETDTSLWIHPIRSNQYVYTEVAPFPEIRINKLKIGNEWSGGILFIMNGWGNFKGRVKSIYHVSNIIEKEFDNHLLSECWIIDATGIHNKLGTSTLSILYHKDYGFLEMNYVFYNGVRIQFILEEISKSQI